MTVPFADPGGANCARCGIWVPGYGAINGLICSDLYQGNVRNLIYCYRNECRTVALIGMIRYAAGPLGCTECGVALTSRSLTQAMLAVDIQATTNSLRTFQFCYVNGSRDKLLAQAVL